MIKYKFVDLGNGYFDLMQVPQTVKLIDFTKLYGTSAGGNHDKR